MTTTGAGGGPAPSLGGALALHPSLRTQGTLWLLRLRAPQSALGLTLGEQGHQGCFPAPRQGPPGPDWTPTLASGTANHGLGPGAGRAGPRQSRAAAFPVLCLASFGRLTCWQLSGVCFPERLEAGDPGSPGVQPRPVSSWRPQASGQRVPWSKPVDGLTLPWGPGDDVSSRHPALTGGPATLGWLCLFVTHLPVGQNMSQLPVPFWVRWRRSQLRQGLGVDTAPSSRASGPSLVAPGPRSGCPWNPYQLEDEGRSCAVCTRVWGCGNPGRCGR